MEKIALRKKHQLTKVLKKRAPLKKAPRKKGPHIIEIERTPHIYVYNILKLEHFFDNADCKLQVNHVVTTCILTNNFENI